MTITQAAAFLDERWEFLVAAAMPVSLCRADAEDAAQNTAEKLLRHFARLDAERVHAWLFVVSRREAQRIQARRRRAVPYEDALGAAIGRDGEDASAAAALGVDVGRGLAGLKPQERAALADRALGFSYREIAARRGWSPTKVNRCVTEGRAALRLAVAA